MVKRCFLLLLLLAAQAGAVDLRFLVFDLEAARDFTFHLADPGSKTQAPLPVFLSSNGTAIPVEPVKGSFGMEVRSLGESAAKARGFSVKVDPAIKSGLVVLFPDPKAPTGFRGEVFAYDRDSFSRGSYRFLNASGREWTVDLGGDRYLLPATRKPVDAKPTGESLMEAAIAAVDEPLKPRYTSLWKLEPKSRKLVILAPGKVDSDPPEVRIFPVEPTPP